MSNSQFHKPNAMRRYLMKKMPFFEGFLFSNKPNNPSIGHPKVIIDWFLTGNKFGLKNRIYIKDLKYIFKVLKEDFKHRSDNREKLIKDSVIEKLKLKKNEMRFNELEGRVGVPGVNIFYHSKLERRDKLLKIYKDIHINLFKFKFRKLTPIMDTLVQNDMDSYFGMIKDVYTRHPQPSPPIH